VFRIHAPAGTSRNTGAAAWLRRRSQPYGANEAQNGIAESASMVRTHRYLAATARPALALCALIALSLIAAARAGEPLHVDGGAIADTPLDANGVRNFKGIPFAAPPVGALRWREPQPVKPWQGERSADQFGPRCMQTSRLGAIDPLNPRISEDCLYLNLWTPANAANDKLPVMVWIYGGSFNVGAGSEPWYNGANLAKNGVIVVTLNYRVDVFGFLAHPDLTTESEHHASGNYGLQDQLAALAWVKRTLATLMWRRSSADGFRASRFDQTRLAANSCTFRVIASTIGSCEPAPPILAAPARRASICAGFEPKFDKAWG
jgi:hypothetical protein